MGLMEETGYRAQPNPAPALAAAVASEFNDELTLILNHVELSLAQLASEHPAVAELKELEHAALRCADITRRLLAFTRRSGAVCPVPLERVLGL